MRLWLQLYKHIFLTSLMTSPGHKIGQILKLIYLRQYLSYSVDQKLKMSEMLMAIFLVYSTSGITSGKISFSSSKWRPFWKFWNVKHSFNLTSDMKRAFQIMPQKVFMVMTSLMTSQGGLKVSLYIHHSIGDHTVALIIARCSITQIRTGQWDIDNVAD